ncbi:Protein TIPIN [Orchesella cincta]|uniref:TIMELESS-interacting protein n=1 Tax=Orchesella cincta TaxID=48709 RepID=A0A1D2NK51_ORCCI|nr:Protein TIPIN [Orchesella cincta]
MSYSDDERGSVRSSSPVPRGLFSGSDNSGDENEDDRQSRRSGGSPAPRGGEVDSDAEEERKEQEAKRKKEEERKKKQKAKGPVKRTQIHEEMLIGRKGVSTIPEIFKDFQFSGKGREREDLGKILAKIEHWVHLLHPKHPFDQSLQRMEFLGLKRKVVKTHLKKIRMGMLNEEIITNEEVVEDQEGDDDMEFPNFEGNEMEQDEMRRAMSHQEPSATATAQSSGLPNDDDGFPDDDDILAAMNEGFETGASAANAQSNQQDDEDSDMDVDMGDETVNVFSRDMELALKRAEMAETQIEKGTQLASISDSTIDSSAVSDAVARAFQSFSGGEVENSSPPEALSVPDSEIISASSSTIDSSAVSDAIAKAFQSSEVEAEEVPENISASESLLGTPTLTDSPVVDHPPSSASSERIDETLKVQSEETAVTETGDNGISLDDLQDADEDEDME